MDSVITTALDVVALLAVAVGVCLGLWPLVGGFALIPAGILIGAGSWYAAYRADRAERAAEVRR